MKSTGIVRKMDDLGRFVIPKSLRTNCELDAGTKYEIEVDGNMILVKKYIPRCCLCRNKDESCRKFNGKNICAKCLNELKG